MRQSHVSKRAPIQEGRKDKPVVFRLPAELKGWLEKRAGQQHKGNLSLCARSILWDAYYADVRSR